ncbi:hypothetical protein NTA01_25065, partial [Pseudomonas aeruginosa]|nr:hypothetical protein [Pseudomonas aeruginosa]
GLSTSDGLDPAERAIVERRGEEPGTRDGGTEQRRNAAEPQRHDRLAAFIKLSRYCGSALDEI